MIRKVKREMNYLISYDIRDDSTRNGIIQELSDLGAKRVLLSQWELREEEIDKSLNELFESLRDLMNDGDGLMIVKYPRNPQRRKYQKPQHLDPQ